MSRVNHAIKNMKFSMFFYLIFLVLQFVSRKLFLDNLGDEFMGLSSTLRSFLSFLNLAELGIGAAVGFSLYKPIFNKEYERINELISLFGHLYKKIGSFILMAGLILSAFFPVIFDDLNASLSIVYYTYYTFLLGMCLNFFFNYHILLLQADQKDYVITSSSQSINLLKIIVQCVIVYYFESIYGWITLELLYYIINSYILRKKVKEFYPWLHINQKTTNSILKSNPEIIKKVKQISFHKLGAFVTGGTDKILIFSFISIESVAFFANYEMLFSRLLQFVNTAFAGTAAGIGNLVAENNKDNINKVFWEMMSLRFYIGGIAIIVLYFVTEPFIIVWLGEKYILNNYVLSLFLTNMFIMQIRIPVDHFKDAYGLYQDVWAPVIQSLINLGSSIILLQYFDLAGILMGTTIAFSIVILMWRPYFLYKHGFKVTVWRYWKGFFILILSFVVPFYLCFLLQKHITLTNNNLWGLIVYALKITSLAFAIYTPFIYALNSGFRHVTKRLLSLIKMKK
ncbi:O-antigen/teichoic acid export membrane protein [Winogradskyella epiphytica]|uniref:O-antigen/teichoic acid export membrane protein n=1 Tax=Winogradskyella epiphytica TaxID=262005 RepID=A0A2V4WWU2_9FLAO|nr:sugar transporter [Winogradskyella epiphytica]PYE81700.1 O-antigen/teichoic acid export membrane protein [Winogradskyella epiphytica]GGW63291.1 sugar transporter [Winogradskyella epiphytica]